MSEQYLITKSYVARISQLEKQLEQAQAANQKLVECLEWHSDPKNLSCEFKYWGTLPEVFWDKGQRARQTLSEVKGNVSGCNDSQASKA